MLSAVEGEVESQAVCPQHPERAAVRTCARCGRYVCSGCEQENGQCRECMRLSALEVPDSRGRARRAVTALQFSAATDLLSLGLHVILSLGVFTEEVQGVPAAGVVFLNVGGGLLAQVFLLMWFHRVVRQLKALGRDIGDSPAMAVWWWLIPLANWVKPYHLMKDVATRLGGAHFASVLPLSVWWGANVLSRIMNQVDQRIIGKLETADGGMSTAGAVVGLIAAGSALVMALFSIQIIRALQEKLDQRRDGLEFGDGPVPEAGAEAA
ncbi:DUF4328 domain-containing protein [Corallococcus sp. AB030]|nr:DUF4328 domain-containing protein [Corallococcus sp. CA041A]RKI17858.1 DUF4328 domain-containing protein [Corallococcus sp. AB030]RUO87925.1 DUF4328 domain-containing protein [Corallococcus sp. AB018]